MKIDRLCVRVDSASSRERYRVAGLTDFDDDGRCMMDR